jgi:hypothetical protein
MVLKNAMVADLSSAFIYNKINVNFMLFMLKISKSFDKHFDL